jgi:hypothetical protein
MKETRNCEAPDYTPKLGVSICTCCTSDLKILPRMPLTMQGLVGFGPFVSCLLIILCLVSLPKLALSQSVDQCVEAASLWLPSDSTSAKAVSKWQREQQIKFAIVSNQKNSPAVKLTEAGLNFVSLKAGLNLVELDESSSVPLPDLLVVVDPSVATDAPILRNIAQKFFEQKLLRRFQIDAEFWNENLRKFSPKCVAFNVEVNNAKNVAFLIVQENETPACVRIGLGETFGIIGARNYYAVNGETIPEDIFGKALLGLYSEKIRSGMNRVEALKQVQEDCKK